MPNLAKIFSENARRISKEKGWSDKDLAKKVGISPSQIAALFSKGNPTLEMVSRFSDALGIKADVLFLDPEKPQLRHAKILGESFINLIDSGADPATAADVVLTLFSELRHSR